MIDAKYHFRRGFRHAADAFGKFEEEKHERYPVGDPRGGQFAPKASSVQYSKGDEVNVRIGQSDFPGKVLSGPHNVGTAPGYIQQQMRNPDRASPARLHPYIPRMHLGIRHPTDL